METPPARSILLIGMRSSGKSTVGAALARRLGLPFVDLDAKALAQFSEASVREVWSTHGEAAWRRAEAAMLAESLDSGPAVIALGGGTPQIPQARRIIDQHRRDAAAFVVYLRASAQEIERRLCEDPGDRPALRGADVVREASDVLREREPVYASIADLVVDAMSGTPQEIAEAIAAAC